MGNNFLSWQAQVTAALLVLGGGYIAFVNKWAPFNHNGLFDQLMKIFPKGNASDNSSDNNTIDDSSDGGGNNLPMPTSPIPNPPTGMPGQPPTLPLSPFIGSPQSNPTQQSETVYENYAKALNFLYGQGNKANVSGNPNVPFIGGDPNLGTTPVPSGLINPQGSGAAVPPGYPTYPSSPASGMNPNFSMGGPPGAPNQLQFPGPATLPTQPFLPSPMQYPGPTQPGPYPASPPRYPSPMGMPVPPLPPFYADLGIIDVGFRGFRVADLISMGVPVIEIFPHGIDEHDIGRINQDIRNYIHKILSRVNNGFRGSIRDIIMDETKRWKKKNKKLLGHDNGLGGLLGDILGGGGSISQGGGLGGGTSINIPGLFNYSQGGGPGGGTSISGLGGLFGGGNNTGGLNLSGLNNIPAGVLPPNFMSNLQSSLPSNVQGLNFNSFGARKTQNSMHPYIKRRTKLKTRISGSL